MFNNKFTPVLHSKLPDEYEFINIPVTLQVKDRENKDTCSNTFIFTCIFRLRLNNITKQHNSIHM
jgi:hypothetical protein